MNTDYLISTKATTSGVDQLKQKLNELAQTANSLGYANSKVSTSFKNGNTVITGSAEQTNGAVGKISTSIRSLNTVQKEGTSFSGDFVRALRRVLIVVPLWAAFRFVIQAVSAALQAGVRAYIEFEKEMGRVATVTKATGASLKEFNQLKQEAIQYAQRSTASLKDTASAMYHLATAGIATKDVIQGFDTVLNLSIGTMTSVEQVGKLISGAFNLFGNALEATSTSADKFQRIADVMAYTFATQQVELSEVATAFGYAANAANSITFSYEALVGTIGFLNTGLLKGSKSGTALTNAIVQASSKIRELERITKTAYDPSKPLDFIQVMQDLNKAYGKGKLSIEESSESVDLFGRRGIRAINSILQRWEDWEKSIKAGGTSVEGFNRKLKEQMENNVPRQLELLGAKWKASWAAMGTDAESSLFPVLKALNNILDSQKNIEIEKILKSYKQLLPETPKIAPKTVVAGIDVSYLEPITFQLALWDLMLKSTAKSGSSLNQVLLNLPTEDVKFLSASIESVAKSGDSATNKVNFLSKAIDKGKSIVREFIKEGKDMSLFSAEIDNRFKKAFLETLPEGEKIFGMFKSSLSKFAEEFKKVNVEEEKNARISELHFKDLEKIRKNLSVIGFGELQTEKLILDTMRNKLGYSEKALDVQEQIEKVQRLELKNEKELFDKKLQLLQAEGATGLQIAALKVKGLQEELGYTKESQQVIEAIYELERERAKLIGEQASKVKGLFTEAIRVSLDTGDISDFVENFRTGLRGAVLDAVAEGFSNQVLAATGLDKMLGSGLAALKMEEAFEVGGTSAAMKMQQALHGTTGAFGGGIAKEGIGLGGGMIARQSGVSQFATITSTAAGLYPGRMQTVPIAPADYYKSMESGNFPKAPADYYKTQGAGSNIFNMANFQKLLGGGLLLASLFGSGKGSRNISQQYATAPSSSAMAEATTRSTTIAKVTNINFATNITLDGASLNDKKTIEKSAQSIVDLASSKIMDILNRENVTLGN